MSRKSFSVAIAKEKNKRYSNSLKSLKSLKNDKDRPLLIEKSTVRLDQVPLYMIQLIKKMEARSIRVLAAMKKVIHSESPPNVVREMTEWKDDYDLNIVHYAILNRRPEVVRYLLTESGVFPENSQPYTSPYAHLAAYLGSSVIVKIILTHRPGDFFAISRPDQNISLPAHLIKRFDIKPSAAKNIHVVEKFQDVMGTIQQFCRKNVGTDESISSLPDDINNLIVHLNELHLRAVTEKRAENLAKIRPKQDFSKSHRILRRPKTYKELFFDEYNLDSFLGKSPLTIAAEKCDTKTLLTILETVYSSTVTDDGPGPLQLAVKAACPEAVTMLLHSTSMRVLPEDYEAAVLEAVRQLFPDCLIAALSSGPSLRKKDIFGSGNLYHILYGQSIDADQSKYAMLPVMTKALIYCNVNVNDYSKPQTFPLYSLITSLFYMRDTNQIYYTLECLKCLLAAGADPFFDEKRKIVTRGGVAMLALPVKPGALYRDMFHSATECILENALKSRTRASIHATPFTNIIVRSCILFILLHKNADKSLHQSHLAMYLEKACYLGLDEFLIRRMLESGVNPSLLVDEDQYPINFYFQGLFSFFRKYQRVQSYEFYKKELGILIVVCRAMEPVSLRIAVRKLLNQYIRNIPTQAVPITQYFLYLADNLIKERKARGEDFDLASEWRFSGLI